MLYITVNCIRHIDWSLPCCCQYGGTWESCYPCFPWYQPYAQQVSWQLNLQSPIHHIKEGKDIPRKSKNHSTCYDLQFLFSRCFVFKWYDTMRCLASFITTTKKLWMYPRDAYRLVQGKRELIPSIFFNSEPVGGSFSQAADMSKRLHESDEMGWELFLIAEWITIGDLAGL